jgi:hypothetical protein
LKYFIAVGKDGFTCFLSPGVEMLTDLDSARSIQDVVFGAFEQFGANFIPDKKRQALRKERLDLLNTSEDNRSEEGFIKIAPKLQGRITN